ncbi:MAG TPA: hypothetical protein VHL59_17330 [Thermoanaerobaculia bacterium]|nr:hypothetical protein [Thermoanaerobaculia bacterium]
MSRKWVVAAFLLIASSPLLAGLGPLCKTTVTESQEGHAVISIAQCEFTTGGTRNKSIQLYGDHKVTPGNGHDVDTDWGYCGTSISISPYDASTLYSSTATFIAYEGPFEIERRVVTGEARTEDPIRPRTEEPTPTNDPDQTCDRTLGCSPIVINFTGGYALAGADDPVLFDIDADGVKNRIGWTARGSDEAFLALDVDGNGRIDDGRELFGNAIAANGFEALRALDDNGDGAIDARDRIWPRLLLWRDADHDGLSTAAELTSVAATAIHSFDLGYAWTGRVDPHGNEFRYAAALSAISAGARVQRQLYDVFFVSVP